MAVQTAEKSSTREGAGPVMAEKGMRWGGKSEWDGERGNGMGKDGMEWGTREWNGKDGMEWNERGKGECIGKGGVNGERGNGMGKERKQWRKRE